MYTDIQRLLDAEPAPPWCSRDVVRQAKLDGTLPPISGAPQLHSHQLQGRYGRTLTPKQLYRSASPRTAAAVPSKPPHPFRALCDPAFIRRPLSARASRTGSTCQPLRPSRPTSADRQSSGSSAYPASPHLGMQLSPEMARDRETFGGSSGSRQALSPQRKAGFPTPAGTLEEAGIEPEIAPLLTGRLKQLYAERPDVLVWLLVDTCRDCAAHNQFVRHDERIYKNRFLHLKKAVERCFPAGLVVERLTDPIVAAASSSNGVECSPCGAGAGGLSDEPVCLSADLRMKETRKNRACSAAGVRIGAFEVYLCFRDPLILGGAAILPVPPGPPSCKGGRGKGSQERILRFHAVCLASKLKTRLWPAADAVIGRLLGDLPHAPLEITAKTDSDQPVPHTRLTARPEGPDADTGVMLGGEEVAGACDGDGRGRLFVPTCVPIRVTAHHPILMKRQECELCVTSLDPSTNMASIHFRAEHVVQLWQAEENKELVVYRYSPRLSQHPGEPPALDPTALDFAGPDAGFLPQLEPFQGDLETIHDTTIRPDEFFCLRALGDPLADVSWVRCHGWRAGEKLQRPRNLRLTNGLYEIARLRTPVVEVSCIAPCCGTNLPGAQVVIDREDFGTTGLQLGGDASVTCEVRCGSHALVVRHGLAPCQAIVQSLNITDSTTRGVEVPLPLQEVRFVCVARPGSLEAKGLVADLYLVGGDLQAWRSSYGAPPADAKLWLWDGELRGNERTGGRTPSARSLSVEQGILCSSQLGYGAGPSSHTLPADDEASADQTRCMLSSALAEPVSPPENPWQVALSRAAIDKSSCIVSQLARTVMGETPPAVWLARLRAESKKPSKGTTTARAAAAQRGSNAPPGPLHVRIRSTCCGGGFEGVKISLEGANSCAQSVCMETGADGEVTLAAPEPMLSLQPPCSGRQQGRLRVEGLAACQLPGGSSEYLAHLNPGETTHVDLDVACLLWIYWVPPEADEDQEDDYQDWDEAPSAPEGTVWISAVEDLVPEEALPIKGVLRCRGAERQVIPLPGSSISPVLLRPSQESVERGEGHCLVAQVELEVDAPEGYSFRMRDPSPLAERFLELGGCELQRLMLCPCVVGYLKQV
eukprot:TRINITY_DN55794_c0_g1_i1.p1 TRINITY_DN55794_c0_g1~~TRINITY_DN55794_c0_g1_i1.p1  ORF type:complete len:1104 (+),score=158.38 TRINITY_DN55794_c0_g1_i1:190-3501(+)